MDARAILIPASPDSAADNSGSRSESTPRIISASTEETTANYLVRVSKEFIDAINGKDFAAAEAMSGLFDHDRFQAQLTDFPAVSSYEQHIGTYKQIYAVAPDIYLTIGESSVTLDDPKSSATVYINVEVAGQPGGLATQGVSQLEWRKYDKNGEIKWLCINHTAIRGLEGIV